MALSGTDRGVGSHNSSTTSFVCAPTSTIAAGSMGVLKIAIDNSGAAGGAVVAPAGPVTDSAGNSWTRRASGLYDNGNANQGAEIAIYTATMVTQLTSGGNVTLTLGVAAVAKTWAFEEIAPGANKLVAYVTGAVNAGATTGTPTVNTSSITSGDAVCCAGAAESSDTWAGDADTSNGNWSTHQHTVAGSGATGMSITSQRKVVTGTATQTYNPTLTSADCILAWIQVRELNAYSLTADGGAYSESGTAASLLFNRKLAAAGEAYSVSGTAASLVFKRIFAALGGSYAAAGTAAALLRKYTLVADGGAYILAGGDATLTYEPATGQYTLTAGAGTFVVTGTAAGLFAGRALSASSASFSLPGASAGLLWGRKLAAGSASYGVTGTAATLVYGQPGIYSLAALSGSFSVAGTAATLRATRVLSAGAGAFSESGTSASLVATRRISAAGGAVVVSGTAASLVFTPLAGSYRLAADVGTFALTGYAATLTVVTPVFGWGARTGIGGGAADRFQRIGSQGSATAAGRIGAPDAAPGASRIGSGHVPVKPSTIGDPNA